MSCRWSLASVIIFALVANSLAQTPTVPSSNSSQDVPPSSHRTSAEYDEEAKDSYWRPHFHPVNNINVQGCLGHGDTAATNNLLNLTRTILDILHNQRPSCVPEFPPRNIHSPISISGYPRDCAEIQDSGVNTSGVYPIYPEGGGNPFFVSCDMETDGGGWTVFQRRQNGFVNFYLNWADYKYGFGSIYSEHWLGNDNIHRLALQKTNELRIDLEDFTGQTSYARYSTFYMSDEDDEYVLTIGEYSGDAGDSLSRHSGHAFTTKDHDNDDQSGVNCAIKHMGAWWFDNCIDSHLNGRYLHGQNSESSMGVAWESWPNIQYSLKKSEMKIRPV